MAANESPHAELGNTGYELFVAALSVLSLVNIVLMAFLQDDATQRVVQVLDLLLSLVFLIDFLLRLRRAPSRAGYFVRQYGWADLLASLPFPQFKALRVFRLIRVARLLRRNGGRSLVRSLVRDRAGSALFTLLLIGVLVLEFGSLAMLKLERGAENANIATASDALWYVVVTMATVGYGDRFPVTTAGRELGTFIIVVGVGIFGTLTGYLANLFLEGGDASSGAETTAPAAHGGAADEDAAAGGDAAAGTDSAQADPGAQLRALQELLIRQQAAVDALAEALRRR